MPHHLFQFVLAKPLTGADLAAIASGCTPGDALRLQQNDIIATQRQMQRIMGDAKKRLEKAIPFAMEPVVYDFTINEDGTASSLLMEIP